MIMMMAHKYHYDSDLIYFSRYNSCPCGGPKSFQLILFIKFCLNLKSFCVETEYSDDSLIRAPIIRKSR